MVVPLFYGESISSVIDISTHPKNENSNTNIAGNLIEYWLYSKIKPLQPLQLKYREDVRLLI
jgi:hypothetical protein